MSTSPSSQRPLVAQVNSDGTGSVALPEGIEHVQEETPERARVAIIGLLARHATASGAPVRVRTTDPDGCHYDIQVTGEGAVLPLPETTADPPARTPTAPQTPALSPERFNQPPPQARSSQPARPAKAGHSEAPAPNSAPSMPRQSGILGPGPVAATPTSTNPAWTWSEPMPSHTLTEPWREAIREKNAEARRASHIIVVSLKGGVGKTTTSIGVGAALALAAADRVIALDANHYGTLATRLPYQVEHTISDLTREHSHIDSFVALRRYLSTNGARLHAIRGSTVVEVGDYEHAATLAECYADVVITDCGTDLNTPMAKAALMRATSCVIVVEPASDAITAGHSTLEHLTAHHPVLAQNSVIAVCHRTRRKLFRRAAKPSAITAGRPTVTIPFDGHLHRGDVIDHSRLRHPTRKAYTQLASLVLSRT